MKMKSALVLLAALAAAPIYAEAPDTYTDVANLVEEARNEWGAPGMSVAVVVDGRIAWSRGFGVADVENDVEARPDTVYRIASISKPISATAILQLVEKGKLSLDDPVTKHVPSFPDHGLGITVRHLLTHTSGIRHYKEGEMDLKDHFDSVGAALEIFRNDPLLFTPGTKYSYSSYAYNLLGAVVESASGLTFEAYLKENV